MCLLFCISSAVSVPASASEITTVVLPPVSYTPYHYTLSSTSFGWYFGTTSPLNPYVLWNPPSSLSLNSYESLTTQKEYPYTMSTAAGMHQIKSKFSSSPPVAWLSMSIPLQNDYSLSGGYSLVGSVGFSVSATLPTETDSLIKNTVLSYVDIGGVTSFPSSDGFCYVNFNRVVPNEHSSYIPVTLYFSTLSLPEYTIPAGTYSYYFDIVSKSNLVYREYPSSYTLTSSDTSTPGSPGDTELPTPGDPVSPPSTGGDSSVDLTETNQKIDAVGEKVDGVKDAVDSATSAIQNGNQQASQERQGILQAILNLPKSLLDGIVHLFVPDQEDIMEVKQAYDDLLEDRFGFFAQAGTLLVSLFTGIASSLNSGSAYTFQFPGITLPFNGTNYVIVEAQSVSLDNAFMSVCRPVLGTGVTIIACCALINTLIRFFEVIIGDKFDNTLRGG